MELKIEYLPIESLEQYTKNTRKHKDEDISQIMKSIQEFGFSDPIGIWSDHNVIVEGHGRYLSAKKLGMTEVPCIRLDHLTDEQRRAYGIMHNKTAELSEWDFDMLSAELNDLNLSEFDVDFGVDFGNEEEKEIIEDEVPEIDEDTEPIAKYGDIYQLGRHRLMCGDSTNTEDVEKLLNYNTVYLTFTDPPYELKTQGGGVLKKSNSMNQISANKVNTFNPLEMKLYSDTNIYCHNKPLIKKYIELAELNGKAYDLCFYKKTNVAPNYKGHLMTDVEYIAIIGNQDPNKHLDKSLYSKCYIGQKDFDNELSYSKPVELCTKFIKLYSKGQVLDLFGGSGSTLIACEQLQQDCFIMEKNPKYVDVIIKRWETFTGQKAELVENINGKL